MTLNCFKGAALHVEVGLEFAGDWQPGKSEAHKAVEQNQGRLAGIGGSARAEEVLRYAVRLKGGFLPMAGNQVADVGG